MTVIVWLLLGGVGLVGVLFAGGVCVLGWVLVLVTLVDGAVCVAEVPCESVVSVVVCDDVEVAVWVVFALVVLEPSTCGLLLVGCAAGWLMLVLKVGKLV